MNLGRSWHEQLTASGYPFRLAPFGLPISGPPTERSGAGSVVRLRAAARPDEQAPYMYIYIYIYIYI